MTITLRATGLVLCASDIKYSCYVSTSQHGVHEQNLRRHEFIKQLSARPIRCQTRDNRNFSEVRIESFIITSGWTSTFQLLDGS